MLTPEFIAQAKRIKLIILDVDGVFTDGRIFVDDKGLEIKAFHVLDGQGIKLLQQTPVEIAIISGRDAPGVTHRMEKLGIQHIYQGHTNKIPVFEKLLETLKLSDQETAYVGDDLPDLPILKRVGLAITVPNAVKEIKQHVSHVTSLKGGKGAVREVCENIMRAQETWDDVVKKFLP